MCESCYCMAVNLNYSKHDDIILYCSHLLHDADAIMLELLINVWVFVCSSVCLSHAGINETAKYTHEKSPLYVFLCVGIATNLFELGTFGRSLTHRRYRLG